MQKIRTKKYKNYKIKDNSKGGNCAVRITRYKIEDANKLYEDFYKKKLFYCKIESWGKQREKLTLKSQRFFCIGID